KPDTVLSDVGSVKQCALAAVLPQLEPSSRPSFVPAHPIAGSEKSGPKAAFAELFQNKKVILTPHAEISPIAQKRITELWESAGAVIEIMDAEEHDRIYAYVSHQVQFLAFCYALFLSQQKTTIAATPEFQKFFRLAGSSPSMWSDILIYNQAMLLPVIQQFSEELKNHMAGNESAASHYFQNLPGLIGKILLKNLPESYVPYTGTGFKDFTSLAGNKEGISPQVASAFLRHVEELQSIVRSHNYPALLEHLQQARHHYRRLAD
ncbi:MAG: prephenate dehydrogenase/arogenate dehydrogenase family protein, partial [Rectinemataceae bacterium]|nr:prephenate dehydrogenase/arogenate dehydrogenase family protein [Rectinemataceae bacterium]